jgi:hypothetical protein
MDGALQPHNAPLCGICFVSRIIPQMAGYMRVSFSVQLRDKMTGYLRHECPLYRDLINMKRIKILCRVQRTEFN